MGYFDGIAEKSFNTDERGQQIFFPFGKNGKGYIMETDAQYEACFSYAKRRLMVMLGSIVVAMGLLNLEIIYLFVLIGVIAGADYLWVKATLKNFKVAPNAFDGQQSAKRSAQTIGLPWLIACEVIAMVFILLGFYIWPTDPTTGLISIVFFGFCALSGAKMIKRALDQKQ